MHSSELMHGHFALFPVSFALSAAFAGIAEWRLFCSSTLYSPSSEMKGAGWTLRGVLTLLLQLGNWEVENGSESGLLRI